MKLKIYYFLLQRKCNYKGKALFALLILDLQKKSQSCFSYSMKSLLIIFWSTSISLIPLHDLESAISIFVSKGIHSGFTTANDVSD